MNILKEIESLTRSKSMQDEEFVELFETAKKADGLILEIGCFRGNSTIVMALASKQKILTVDPFIAHGTIEQNKKAFLNNIEKFKVADQIKLFHGYSKDLAIDTELGMLLIDGDHTYEGVKHDFLKFEPHVKEGGYIVMHDFHLPGIKKFFDEEIWSKITKFKEFKITRSLIVIRK